MKPQVQTPVLPKKKKEKEMCGSSHEKKIK
jgi:hypothetical protein